MAIYFKNLNIKDTTLQVDMYNLDTSIVNSFRRIGLSDIPGKVFGNVEIIKNTSVLNNEILLHRISLIPLNIDCEDNVCIELNVRNDTNDIMDITSSDIKVISGNLEICKDILLVELKKDEKIILKAYVIKGTGKKHSKFQSTGTIYFKIKKNMTIDKILWNKLSKKEKESIIYFNNPNVKIKNSKALNSMSIMELNSNLNEISMLGYIKNLTNNLDEDIDKYIGFEHAYYNKKYIYHFIIEGLVTNPYTIFKEILNYLEKIIKDLHSKQIELKKDIDRKHCINIIIDNSDHTIGNILATELNHNNKVEYSYYIKEHPLKNKIILTYKLYSEFVTDDDSYDAYIEQLLICLNNLEILCNSMKEEWNNITINYNIVK